MKEHQAVTGGIFYCRDSAGFSVSASNKFLCNLTGKCFGIGNKNIPPIRYVTGYVTFFDIATRDVYYTTKMKGAAGSKSGFNLYWSNGIKRLTGYFFDAYYRKLK